ncbi:MAG: hypothetical protein RJAPGHWK_001380 [Candidatus Fervidibacter sp.]
MKACGEAADEGGQKGEGACLEGMPPKGVVGKEPRHGALRMDLKASSTLPNSLASKLTNLCATFLLR